MLSERLLGRLATAIRRFASETYSTAQTAQACGRMIANRWPTTVSRSVLASVHPRSERSFCSNTNTTLTRGTRANATAMDHKGPGIMLSLEAHYEQD